MEEIDKIIYLIEERISKIHNCTSINSNDLEIIMPYEFFNKLVVQSKIYYEIKAESKEKENGLFGKFLGIIIRPADVDEVYVGVKCEVFK